MKKWFVNTYFILFLLLLFSAMDVFVGSISLFENTYSVNTILLEIRVPKTLTAVASGGILALCGLVLQIIFRNPLAGPYILGISSAASLFTAIGMMSIGVFYSEFWSQFQTTTLSVIGAFVGLLIILLVLKITEQITVILLVGLLLSQLYSAILGILSYLSTEQSLKLYTLWTMGSIQNTTLYQALFLVIVSGLALLIMLRYIKFFMSYLVGDELPQLMGMKSSKLKKQLLVIVAVLVGIVTAYCGPIAFVGMSIPILVRVLQSDANIKKWIVHSFLYGSLSLTLTDVINQISFNGSVPLNILISIWGVPLMIWVFIKYLRMV